MTYFIYALENTKGQALACQTRTSSKEVAEIVRAHYEGQRYKVNVVCEE